MDARAAKGMAACIRTIAEATARMAVIDSSERTPERTAERCDLTHKIERAEASLAEWLMQPMTWGGGR